MVQENCNHFKFKVHWTLLTLIEKEFLFKKTK